jgi:hypothetical protein
MTDVADSSGTSPDRVLQQILGAVSIAPPPPTAQATVPSAPASLATTPAPSATPTPGQGVATTSSGALPVSAPATALVVLTADPASPAIGQMWYRQDTKQFCIRHDAATTVRVTLA